MKWAVLVLFAALPLQWFVVPLPAAPNLRLHLVVMLLFAGLAFARLRGRAFVPVVTLTWPFLLANLALVVVWCGTAFYHGQPLLDPIQEAILLMIFVAVAAVVHRACVTPASHVLEYARWAAAAAVISLAIALWLSFAVAGVDPVTIFGRMFSTGDPRIVERELFGAAFAGFGYTADQARAAMRHEVVGAVLTAMYLSMTAARLRPFRSTPARFAYRCSLVVGTLMILLSLSRAVIIAAATIPLLAAVRSLVSGRLSPRQLALGAGTTVVGLALGATGIVAVVWNRFTQDTTSYQARDRLLHQAFTNIGEHALTGGVVTAHQSSHDFVLDSWLRAGVFGALFAAGVLVLVVGLWLALLVDLPRAPDWMFPVTAALALPVVRMLTAGAGVIPPVEWICLAMAAGFLTTRGGPGEPRLSIESGKSG